MDLIMCAARPDDATVIRALAAAVQPILADIVSNGWLLTAVREYANKQQWPAETVWLVNGQAFLSRDGEYVNLNLVGCNKPLPVFVLDYRVGWREVAGLDAAYAEWTRR